MPNTNLVENCQSIPATLNYTYHCIIWISSSSPRPFVHTEAHTPKNLLITSNCIQHFISQYNNNNNNKSNHFTALCLTLPGYISTRRNIHPHTLCAQQSFCTICLQVFLGLPLGLKPYTSYSIHIFTESLSSFHRRSPYHHNMLCCSTEIMSSNPWLTLNSYSELCHTSIWPYLSQPTEVASHFFLTG